MELDGDPTCAFTSGRSCNGGSKRMMRVATSKHRHVEVMVKVGNGKSM